MAIAAHALSCQFLEFHCSSQQCIVLTVQCGRNKRQRRTIRPGIPPSEFVVANALHQTLPEFLMSYSEADSLAKFIADRQDNGNLRIFRLAS
jgi:hypothetical protein